MKNILTALLICLLLSCGKHPTTSNNDIEEIPVPVAKLSHFNVEKVLYDWVDKIKNDPDKDSVFYPLEYTEMEEDSSRLIAIGHFIDHEMLNAVDISAPEDGIATFYAYRQNQWEAIGQYPIQGSVLFLEFEDYDGDGRNEIKARGYSNMNGNFSNYFFSYSDKEKRVNYAGDFFSGEFNTVERGGEHFINVNYEGSWYMDAEQTVYRWHDGKLLPLKQVVLSLKKPDMKHEARFISYYENPTKDQDTLVLHWRETYRVHRKKHRDLWEHFFD